MTVVPWLGASAGLSALAQKVYKRITTQCEDILHAFRENYTRSTIRGNFDLDEAKSRAAIRARQVFKSF
jgi:hypothetical protein